MICDQKQNSKFKQHLYLRQTQNSKLMRPSCRADPSITHNLRMDNETEDFKLTTLSNSYVIVIFFALFETVFSRDNIVQHTS